MAPKKPSKANGISAFFHCSNCLNIRPENMSPREWVAIEVGWTKKGIQVWCVRCEKNVIDLDFLGQKVHVILALAVSLSLPSLYSWKAAWVIQPGAPLDFGIAAYFKLLSF